MVSKMRKSRVGAVKNIFFREGKTMKFEEAIKIAGKEYIQDFLRQEHKEVKLPIRFRIKMWWMF